MMKKAILTGVFLSAFLCSMMAWSQVPTHDLRAYKKEIEGAKQATEELSKEMDNLTTSVKSLTDVGSLVDGLLDFNFLIPSSKPKATEDVKKEFTAQQGGSGSSNPVDQAKTATKAITGGSSQEGEQPFPSRTEMEKQVDQMQVKDGSSSDSGDGGSVLDTAKDVVSSATGGGQEEGLTGQEIQGKRNKLPQTKQAWVRYSLATALVNRSLAYRTVSDTKKKTAEKVNGATNMRKAHTAKTHGYSAMAASYNRLLLSQAVANGLSSLKAMDHVEGKINISNPLMDGMGGKMNDLKNFVQ